MRYVLLGALAMVTSTASNAAEISRAADANNAFAFALIDAAFEAKANSIISPSSIWSALAMTSAGAEGETLRQMREVLRLPAADGAAHALVGAWAGDLAGIKGVELRVANRLWGAKGLSFRDSFLQLAEKNYGAGLEALDFKEAPEPSRMRINEWIEEKTNRKIKDLLHEGDILRDTKLVLTNAIYFLGKWANPFDPENTSDREFTIADGGKKSPPTLWAKFTGLDYFEDKRLQAVRLAYEGDGAAMIVVLPRKIDALQRAGFLDGPAFSTLMAGLKAQPKVVVQMPKFEMAGRFELATRLSVLGMKRAFTNSAEFGGLCSEPVKVSEVIHQAWVKVAEKGTEAAAATAVITRLGSAAPRPEEPPKLFIADHPFLFFIVDRRNGGILFSGRVMDPR